MNKIPSGKGIFYGRFRFRYRLMTWLLVYLCYIELKRLLLLLKDMTEEAEKMMKELTHTY